MKLRHRLLSLAALALVALLALPALAQTGGAQPPPLTQGVATALGISLLLGLLQSLIQGSLFGLVKTPPTWLPGLTVAVTFLTGVAGFVTSLSGGFVFSVTDVVYALAAGVAALVSGSAGALVPALAQHAHVTLPAARVAVRFAKRAAVKTAAAVLLMVGLGHATAGCKGAVGPTIDLSACVAGVVNIDAGLPLLQIIADSIAQCGTDLVAILDALAQQLSVASSDGGPAYTLADVRAARAAYLADPNTFMAKLPQARNKVK